MKLKFRAWDKISERMVTGYTPNEHGKREFVWMQFDVGFSHFNIYDFVVMQAIGIKDKNGVEIFEGDIAKCHVFTQVLGENMGVMEGETEFVCEIVFNLCGLNLINIDGDESGKLFYYEDLQDPSQELEVIGNKYENPELLQENVGHYANDDGGEF